MRRVIGLNEVKFGKDSYNSALIYTLLDLMSQCFVFVIESLLIINVYFFVFDFTTKYNIHKKFLISTNIRHYSGQNPRYFKSLLHTRSQTQGRTQGRGQRRLTAPKRIQGENTTPPVQPLPTPHPLPLIKLKFPILNH